MADRSMRVVMDDLRGGMNGVDDPLTLGERECLYALNVDWFRSSIGHKRNGSSAMSTTGSTMTGKVSQLIRHVPSADDTASELWAVDDAATPIVNRWTGSAWSAPTLKDNLTGNGWDIHGATVDGKLFLAYESAVNRLHVWDGSTVRRAGIDPGASAPTVANTGAGAYAATIRYYRVRFTITGGARVSEPTPSVSFTPSGAGTAARVTRPTAPNEGEEYWYLEGSADGVTFYQLAAIAIATATYDDTTAPASYSTGTVSPSTGTFTLQKPYKFIAGADNRLLGFGSWNSADPQHRVEISDVVGGVTLGVEGVPSEDAAERVNTTGGYYVDLDESDSGAPTGLIGPMGGNYYAFKTTQLWELRPTGDATRPFAETAISKTIGAIEQRAITKGEDAQGRPCLYFMSLVGPYRYGANGLEYLGRQVDNYINGTASCDLVFGYTLKLVPGSVAAMALAYPVKHQVWWWITVNEVADSSGTFATLMYDTQTGGWSEYTGLAGSRAVTLYLGTVGGKDLVPYLAKSSSNNTVWRLDDSTQTTDPSSAAFQAKVVTRPIQPGGPGMLGSVSEVEVVTARTTTGGTLTVSAQADLSTVVSGSTPVTLVAGATSQWLRASGCQVGDAHAVHVTVGDASAVSTPWSLERFTIVAHPQEAFVA